MPMKNILRSFFGGLVAAVLAVVAHAADLAPGAFSAGTVKGDVTYKLAGSTQYMPLTSGTALPQGSTVKTGPGSLAVIVFSNGATASIRPGSEVQITKFEQEAFSGPLPTHAEPSVSNTEIKVINGAVVSKVSKLKKGSKYVVSSPVGAAGVRGTIFVVTYNAATGAYTVATLEGQVVFSKASDGSTTTISASESFNGTVVEPLTDAQIATIEAAIRGDIEARGNADAGPSGNGPGSPGPTIPDVDTSINVSVN